MENKNTAGHLSALLTIIIWGTTFISTKVLLTDFQPVEILFFRFIGGISTSVKKSYLQTRTYFCSGGAVRYLPILPIRKYRPYLYNGL